MLIYGSLAHLCRDRMVKSALNWAAGFFGIPYEDQFELELIIETPGSNNTFAP
jgi:hypothetical protein